MHLKKNYFSWSLVRTNREIRGPPSGKASVPVPKRTMLLREAGNVTGRRHPIIIITGKEQTVKLLRPRRGPTTPRQRLSSNARKWQTGTPTQAWATQEPAVFRPSVHPCLSPSHQPKAVFTCAPCSWDCGLHDMNLSNLC